MIVQPDFPDHWKTQLLIKLTDETAVVCLLRFWAHCQRRRQWRFKNLTAVVLAAMCHWDGDKDKWFDAMLQTYIEKDGDVFEAHDWRQINASLISNWKKGKYGRLGGKPSGLATGGAQSPPDKIRLDKSTDKEEESANGSRPAPKGEVSESEWKQGLLDDIAYRHADVRAEFSKWTRWCARHHKKPTRARFEAWLNRIEKPIDLGSYARPRRKKLLAPSPVEMTDEQIEKNKAAAAEMIKPLLEKLSMPQ